MIAKRRFGEILAGMLLAGLLAILGLNLRVDPTGHVEALAADHALRQHHADLIRDLVLLRHGLLTHYDTLDEKLGGLAQQTRRLDNWISERQADQNASPALILAAAPLSRDVETLGEIVDRFKSDIALFRNSLSHLPTAMQALIIDLNATDLPDFLQDAHLLLEHILIFSQTEASHHGEEIPRIMERLTLGGAALGLVRSQRLQVLLRHAEIILSTKGRVEQRLTEAIQQPLSAHLDRFMWLYSRDLEQRLAQARNYRRLLFAGASILLIYVAVTVFRLERQRGALQQAHENLSLEMNARREAGDQLRKLGLAVAQSPVSTVITDLEGRIEYVNPKFLEATGYTREEVIGQNPRILKSGKTPNGCYADLWRTLLDGGVWRGEFHNRRKDGGLYWESATISAVKNEAGETICYLGVKEDITERKRLESELQQLLLTLDERVAQRTQELRQKVAELQKTRQYLVESEKMASLGRLVAGFSHELNTPVGVAVGAASQTDDAITEIIAMLDRDAVDEARLAALLETIQETARLTLDNLRRTAEMVMRFKRASVHQSQETPQTFKVHETIQDLLTGFRHEMNNAGIKISVACDPDLTACGLPGLLGQILGHLLINSRIHGFQGGRSGGEVAISAARDGAQLRIDFQDDGVGMDEAVRQRVFEPFFTTDRGQGSSGLGLFVCYNLITNRLGGTIQCESRTNRGAHFILKFPAHLSGHSADVSVEEGPLKRE